MIHWPLISMTTWPAQIWPLTLLQAMEKRQKDQSLGQFAGYILAEVRQDRE